MAVQDIKVRKTIFIQLCLIFSFHHNAIDTIYDREKSNLSFEIYIVLLRSIIVPEKREIVEIYCCLSLKCRHEGTSDMLYNATHSSKMDCMKVMEIRWKLAIVQLILLLF